MKNKNIVTEEMVLVQAFGEAYLQLGEGLFVLHRPQFKEDFEKRKREYTKKFLEAVISLNTGEKVSSVLTSINS